LTANIDLKDVAVVPMGTETNPFVGSFNGAGHHISNMVIDNQTKEAQGLFGYVGDACAISNVVIDNSCSIKAKSKSAALVGVVAGSGDITISGCSNFATISGENYMAGLVGYNSSLTASVIMKNCLNTGNVTITAAEGYAGGLAASLGENASVENCLNVGTITGANTALARVNTGTITNCYQIDTETAQANVTAVSAAELASGLICYNLNEQTTTNPIWYQTLESDDFPVLDALHSEIHLSGEKNCDGSIKSAMVYTNGTEDLVVQDEHQWVAGICSVCNACDMDFVEKEGDYFLIGNADQLYWFSKYVENGNTAAKAKLTADIIVNDNLDASTAKVWRPIGSESNAFAGEFDGDGHTVSGLYVDDATTNNIGLIGYANGATIANVGIEDSYLNGYKNIGAICGFAIGTTISHCFNNAAVSGVDAVGGVLGCANTNTVKVKYSYNEGTVTGSRNYAGGVVGYCRLAAVTIENCYNVGTVTGNAYVAGISGYKGSISKSFNYTAIVGNNYVGNIVGEFDGTLSDNYYLETLDIDVNAEAKSTDFFANGELAYVLNGSATDAPVWYQTIGTDNYPVLDNSHSVIHTYLEKNCSGVAKGDVQYVNTDEDQIVQDEHIFVDGMCSICGSARDGFMTPNEDGVFEIANAGELRWFASYVNAGNGNARAKLVADIVLNENVLNEDYTLNGTGKDFVQWTPIGNYSVPFSGSIDGQNHTISGLYFNGPGEYIGLVGYMEGNAGGVAINNLGIINSYIAVEGKGQYVGGFIGSSYCNAAIESCYFNGAISSNNASVGGIIGETSSMDITNCYTEGRIYAKAGNVGGIVGEYSQKTVSNCHNSAMVSSSGDYVGGIVGRAVVDFVYSHRNVATIKDSYNEGEILGTSYVGGICGDHSNYNISERDIRSVYLSNCYNAGKISGSSYVGGIAGKNNLGLTNVQNLATVNGTEEYVGGIVGYGNFVSTAINTGVVTCNGKTTRVGAIAGSISENGGVLSAIYDKDVTSYKGINNDASWEDFVPLSPKSMQAFGLTTEQLCKGQLEGNSETRGWTQNDFFDYYSHIIDVNDNVVDSTLNKRAWSRGNFDVAASNIVTTDNEFGVSQKGLYPYLSSFSYRPAATIKFYNFGDEEDTNWKTYRPIVQVSELYAITTSESDLSANYVLMCDIADYENLDADGKLLDTPVNTWPGIGYCIRSGGLPAEDGDYYEPFRGYFAGRGHTISGLSLISNAGQATNGLINTAENATITGVTIKNSNLANEYLLSSGMICGFAKNTTISDCKSYCNLEGDYYDRVGGICGILENGIVKDCYNYGSISSSGYYIGGIVGSSSGTIMHCGNYGDISSSYNVGGIVGVGGSINYCYNKGTITAHNVATTGSRQGNCAGGIAGIYGTIANCFNVGTIKADENAGGLVGGYATSITSSYNIGSVSGTDAKTAGLGSLVGASSGNTKLSYNYNDTLKCNIGAVDGINTPGSGEGIATIDFCGTLPKGFSPSIWAIRPAEMEGLKNKNYYPYLRYWGPDSAMVAVVVETYQITLEFNGGIAKGTVPTSYASGIGVELPAEVTQNGYAFAGWYSNSNFTSEIYTKVDQAAIGNKIFYARWIADVYDVTLNTNDGRINSGNFASYTFGNNVILPLDVTRTGYTFAGWYDTEDCFGDRILQISAKEFGNKEYWAKWNVVDYTITYNVNGGTINDTDYASAFQYALAEVSLPSDVTRTGYTFAGWYDNSNLNGEPVTSIATTEYGNKEYWAKWDVNTYTVTLEANEGSINSGNLVMYVYDVLSLLPADVTKVGYTFGGWYVAEDCSGEQILQISKGEFGDKKFYAKWTANNYKITLVVNDGTINAGSVSEYTYGEGATLPTDVTRTGYEFDGWYTTSYFDNSNVLTIGTNDFGDKTYWAKWSVASYGVDLVTNGGTINDGTIDNYTFGVGAILPTNVTKIGYEFTGWYTNTECTGASVKEITTADIDDLTFYAGWKKAVYTITFDNNGGAIKNESYATTYSYDVEKTVALPSTVEKTGCTFAGWYDNVNLAGEAVASVATGEYGDKTYYAKWTPNTYTVTLNVNEGVVNGMAIDSYVYGVVASLPTDVTKDGYTFMGWFDNADLTGSAISIIPSTSIGDQTYYASWSTNAYTVTLNTNDGVVKTNSVTGYVYGVGATLPGMNDVEKTGYTFGGWYDNSSYVGTAVTVISKTETGNKSFWAKWSVNSYSIALTLNGGTINSGNVTNYVYGNGANLPSDVTRTGYKFGGWYNVTDSTKQVVRIDEETTGDQSFFAKWTANSYNIILVVNEGTINEGNVESYVYGEGATLPTDVTKDGYTFGGWYANTIYTGGEVSGIAKNDAGDKQFWAKWSINEYVVNAVAENGTVEGTGSYEYKSTATLKATASDGYEFVNWSNGSTDNKIQIVVTKDTTVTANFKEKEKVLVAGTLTIPTMKTEREAAPIDLTGLFTTTEDGEVSYMASSSRPDVVAVSVVEGKLLFAVSALEGEAEITVTATLPNGEKNSVSATASVVLACNIHVTETIKNVSCYGESDGEISVVVKNAFEPYTIQWIGVDNTNDTLPALIAGNYTIDIADAEGCTFQKTYTVVQPQEIVISKSVINPTCANADGSITINVTGGTDFTYIWNNDTTSRSLTNIAKGEYNLVVVNNETGCKAETSVVLTEPDAPVVKVSDVIETACNANNGAVIISGADNLIYKWNNGRATKNLTNVKAGDYNLVVIDPETNCKDSVAVTIPSIPLKQPEIALVTVSQETGNNLVVWLKENTDLIDYYTVYRQSDEKDRYEALDTIAYNDLSVYEDVDANPMVKPWSYRLTATDVCGNETDMSETHRTLHLQKYPGLSNEINLGWTAYEGIDYSTFVIMRETTVNGRKSVDTLTTVSSDITTYTDIVPAEGTSSYYVGIKLPSEVNPKTQFMKAESGPFSLALSNIAEAENDDEGPTAVEDIENQVVVYAIGHTIYVKNADGKDIKIYDNNGRAIANVADENEISVRLDGTYFVKVGNESFAVVIK